MVVVEAASTSPNLKAKPSLRSQSNPKRPPLLPSERENNVLHRRPKSREVSSRYLSSSSSTSTSGSSTSTLSHSSHLSSFRRCPSPIPARTTAPATPAPNSSVIKRSISAERRRPSTPAISSAAKLLVSSTRSLSVSFQGESFAVPKVRTAKPSPTPSSRKGTPERKQTSSTTSAATTPRKGGNQGENARPFEHQPWPGRSRPGTTSLSRSVDLGCEGKKLINGPVKVVRALQESLIRDGNKTSTDVQLRRSMSRDELVKESLVSDTESLSSECNSGLQDSSTSAAPSKGGGRSIMVPARFWQEANSRLKHASDPGSPMARNSMLKGTMPPKLNAAKKFVNDIPGASPKGFSSPLRGSVRPSSPSKMRTPVPFEKMRPSSPSRGMGMGMASPSRVRNPVTSTPSVLSFGADVRRIKVGDNRLGDAHFLRLLHNRHLQWRFVNARAEASLSNQKTNAERSLYNAWRKISDLRGAVSFKKKELQWLRQKLKLVSILKGQMLYLEEWALMDKDHCSSLSGAAESLKASIIRLPVVGGARADIQDMKDAICSAADVMQAMASSICSLLSKVEEANSLVVEVADMTSKEHSLLSECKEILSTLAAMQVKDCSLRAHTLQLRCAPSKLAAKV